MCRQALRPGLLVLLVILVCAAATAQESPAVSPGAVALPDLRIFVPTGLISIGIDPSSGVRELRFTHITADVGDGPFEIDPSYNPRTGISTFMQAIYRKTGPGRWVHDRSVPLATTGQWQPPSDYRFPLTAFTLNRPAAGGSPGAVVARSPKHDYCITGDTRLTDVSNTPDQTFISPSNCDDPTKPLGWSVGWGDEYDQTDAGQPIPLGGIPNGTYLLRAVVDPRHVFTESNTTNDVTDTTVRIVNDKLTVLGQRNAPVILPRVTVSEPRGGARVSGAVTLRATATAPSPDAVRSVQFLLDGRPLGHPVHRTPYRVVWRTDGATSGTHWLSARVSDSEGNLNTARPVQVVVRRPPPLTVGLVNWRHGVLALRIGGVPRKAVVLARLGFARAPARSYPLRQGRLMIHTAKPRTITLTVFVGGRQEGGALTLALDERPTVSIANPTRGETVSGIVPVSAEAAGGVPVAYVQFGVDGTRLGRRVRRPPYAVEWDTRHLSRGTHTLSARVVDVAGNRAVYRVSVRVQNPAPPMTCFVMQAEVNARGEGSVTTRPFHTAMAGETLLALISADGPATARAQTARVTGAGLHWRLVKRANRSYGDSEIWTARAPRVMTAVRISAELGQSGYNESLTVVAMEGADGAGAAAGAGGVRGRPAVSLRTLSSTSLVFAVGNDWDRASSRALPPGWVLLDQWLVTQTDDTLWSQYTNQPTGRAHSLISVAAGGPVTDHWNLAAVELVNDGG